MWTCGVCGVGVKCVCACGMGLCKWLSGVGVVFVRGGVYNPLCKCTYLFIECI